MNRIAHILRDEGLTRRMLAECARTYEGPLPSSSENTSIRGNAAPGVRELLGSIIQPGMTVWDMGAGKYARNADFLRENGVEVYASEPKSGTGDGWAMGTVAQGKNPPPGVRFDVGFTCYVLNVVPRSDERDIVNNLNKHCDVALHITRNRDVVKQVRNSLASQKAAFMDWLDKWFFPGDSVALAEWEETGELSKDSIERLACFGIPTTAGFQRLPFPTGLKQVRKTSGWKMLM